jgi:hypothetical protein
MNLPDEVELQPAHEVFSITVLDSNNTLANLKLKSVNTFTILTDNQNEKKIMLLGENFGTKLTLQPQFKIDFESSTE